MGSGVPQGGAEGPFLYLLATLPLAFAIQHDYPAYAPYPLFSLLVGLADDRHLTVANSPREPRTPRDRPTIAQQIDHLLTVTAMYLARNNLIIHPTKSIALVKEAATAPTLSPQGPAMNIVTDTTYLGVIQTTDPNDTTLFRKLQITPRPPLTICVPAHEGPRSIPLKHGVLPHRRTKRRHRLLSIPPHTSQHCPPASHMRSYQRCNTVGGDCIIFSVSISEK